MKYSNTAIKELTARYRAVLKKCVLIATALFLSVGTASADVSVTGTTVFGGADVTATVTDTETVVTTAAEGQALATQINTNTTAIDTLQTTVAGKADSATTLAGYGITDAYTKTETDSAITTAINELTTNGQVATNTTEIENINDVLGTTGDGNYIAATDTIGENLGTLDTQVKTNADNISANANDIDVINTNIGDMNNISGSYVANTKDIVTNLNDLDSQVTTNTANIGTVGNINSRTGDTVTATTVSDAVGEIDAKLGTFADVSGDYVDGTKTVAENLNTLNNAIGNLQETGVRGENIAAQLQTLGNDLQNLENEVRGGFAASAALSALVPNARATNDTQISLGTGMYRDRAGFAIGAFHYVNDNVLLNAGAAYGGSKSTTVKAGITFGW